MRRTTKRQTAVLVVALAAGAALMAPGVGVRGPVA